jgi:hypothetical protein
MWGSGGDGSSTADTWKKTNVAAARDSTGSEEKLKATEG